MKTKWKTIITMTTTTSNNQTTPYTTLFNSFKRHIRTLTASLEERDFSSFKSLNAFKSHQAENRKLNQLLYSQVQSYLNYVDEINMWFSSDATLSDLIAKRNRDNGNGDDSYVSEAYEIFKSAGVTPLYSKPLISEYLYRISINSGLPFANEEILNSSEWARKEINDEVDRFVEREFSVLIANLVLFLDFAAGYTRKHAEQKGNNKSGKSNKFTKSAGKTAVSNGDNAEATNATEDMTVTGYQDAINWLNGFIKTKAGMAKLRSKVWETLTQGHAVEFL